MRLSSKVLIVAMIVMMICCVSAASATDVDDIAVTEDADIIEVDDAADSVDIVEQDDSSDDIIEDVDDSQIGETDDDIVADEKVTGTKGLQNKIYNHTISKYFDTTTGYIKSSAPSGLIFVGTFDHVPFENFIINKSISLSFSNANFENVGFKLLYPGLTINGATFTSDTSASNVASIYAGANGITIKNVNFNITAPSNDDYYAINVENANNTKILNNIIYYQCGYANPDNYNYAIKVKNSTGVKVIGNNITAILPLKTVKHYVLDGLDKDFVAGVAVTHSNNFNFTKNTLNVTGIIRDGGYPTLDAFIMWYSNNSYIGDNKITDKDVISTTNQYSYIYGIDVFESNYVNINNNTVTMNADQSGGYVGGNGTGAAYCVQLTGGYTGVVVSNNTLITQNHGPNTAIYSQNYNGFTNITVIGNTIQVTGKGTASTWDLVTGMELQDDYAYVAGNTITVNNIGSYGNNYNVYGISYCQASPRTHTYIIINNTVDVINGYYTVYIMNGQNCNITGNTLHSRYSSNDYYGNQTVYIVGNGNYVGPNP